MQSAATYMGDQFGTTAQPKDRIWIDIPTCLIIHNILPSRIEINLAICGGCSDNKTGYCTFPRDDILFVKSLFVSKYVHCAHNVDQMRIIGGYRWTHNQSVEAFLPSRSQSDHGLYDNEISEGEMLVNRRSA